MNETVKLVADMRTRIDAVIEAHRTGSWQAQHHYIGDRVSFLTGTSKARPEDPNQLTRHTGTVERREFLPASPGATVGFVQYDVRDDETGRVRSVNSGRIRMLDDQTPPAPVEPSAQVAPMITIEPRFEMERYGMRGHAGRKSDQVTSWYRWINGKLFGFCRMEWADGPTTLTVYRGRSTEQLHRWVSE